MFRKRDKSWTALAMLSIALLLAGLYWLLDTAFVWLWLGETSTLAALIPSGDALSKRIEISITTAVASIAAIAMFSRNSVKYRNLFDHMLDGAFRCLPDGRILTANPALIRMLGFSSEEELCTFTNARDFYRNPEQCKQLSVALREDGEARNVELELERKNGTYLTVLGNIRAVSGKNGNNIVYEGTFSDASDLLRARSALADSADHCRALTEYSLDVVTVINANGKGLYISPSATQVTGYAQKSTIGQDLMQYVNEDDVDSVKAAIKHGFQNPGCPQSFTYRFRHSDGSTLYLECVCNAYFTHKQELRAVIHSRDVTKRRRTEAQLQQAQKMQAVGQLTGGIAHDFNNLLTIIVGNLQLVEESNLPQELLTPICTALRASLHGAELTRRLLAFSRRQFLEPKVINVNELLAGMEGLVRRSLGDRMQVFTDYADDIWLAKIDPAQLESAILNLAINSRDSIKEGGLITIKTMNCHLEEEDSPDDTDITFGDRVCIFVKDTGSGMSEETLKHAIEPFFSTKENGAGTGLGLSMVYGFVKQSGGHMRLSSSPGEGTTIKMYLPRSQEEEHEHTQSIEGSSVPNGDETVLVVDDNPGVRSTATALLRSLGYRVLEAPSGPAALETLKSEHVDLLFSDVMMPHMTGFDLAELVQQYDPEIRILLTSGYTEAWSVCQGDIVDQYEILGKPYRKRELAFRIRNALEN